MDIGDIIPLAVGLVIAAVVIVIEIIDDNGGGWFSP